MPKDPELVSNKTVGWVTGAALACIASAQNANVDQMEAELTVDMAFPDYQLQ